jgi:hypothetical protein
MAKLKAAKLSVVLKLLVRVTSKDEAPPPVVTNASPIVMVWTMAAWDTPAPNASTPARVYAERMSRPAIEDRSFLFSIKDKPPSSP